MSETRFERILRFREELMRNRTDAEKILSSELRKCSMWFIEQYYVEGRDFHGYYLDFFFPTVSLAVELDGGYHYNHEQRQKDLNRDKSVSHLGITTLRVKNEIVSPEGVSEFVLDIAGAVASHRIEPLIAKYDRREMARRRNAPRSEKMDDLERLVARSGDIIILPQCKVPKAARTLFSVNKKEWVKVNYRKDGDEIVEIRAGGPSTACNPVFFEEVLKVWQPKKFFIKRKESSFTKTMISWESALAEIDRLGFE